MHDVRLEVNGLAFGGFVSGELSFSLESMCTTFRLSYVDVWRAHGERIPIAEGDRCKITIDGSPVFDGWVDESTREYTENSRSLSVSGRSTACDLVDCQRVEPTTQWSRQRVSQIVADLTEPYEAVQAIVLGDEGEPIPKFTMQREESIGDAILRAARLRNLLVYTAGDQLVIAKPGTQRTNTILRYGDPIVKGRRVGSLADRFSQYHFKGQTRARDEVSGVSASEIRNVIADTHVPRYRPKLIVAGGADGPSDLGARAIMERNQRAGRGERLSLHVAGWKTIEGYFWEPNLVVRVDDDELDVDQDMIVVSSSLSFGLSGWMTDLELCDPRAFQLEDPPIIRRPRRRQDAIRYISRDESGRAIAVTSFNAVTGVVEGSRRSGEAPLSNDTIARIGPAPQPSRANTPRRRRR